MKGYHYVGLDVHKKTIAYYVKEADGRIVEEDEIGATRRELAAWAEVRKRPWKGAMEATMFTGWGYDFLSPYAEELKVGHSCMLRAICASKKKNDRVDARKRADTLRCDWFPECQMAPPEVRELRQVLRYRNLLVREAAKLAPCYNSQLAEVYAKERAASNDALGQKSSLGILTPKRHGQKEDLSWD